MSVSLSIKDVPDRLAGALRARAAESHRSIQGELMHILESALRRQPLRGKALAARLRALNFTTPVESARMIRADRDR